MNISRKKVGIAALLSVIMILSTFTALNLYTKAVSPVPVSIQPPTVTVTPGALFWVNVVVGTLPQSLDAFDIMVDYNSALMTPINVQPGPIVPPPDLSLFHYDLSMADHVHFWDLPPNGAVLLSSGTLASIQFKCINVGLSSISVNPGSVFLDTLGNTIPVMPTSGCLVTQQYPTATTIITPPTITVPVCTPFTVNVNVQGVTNLYRFDLKLTYDTAPVDAIDIVPGSFLPSPVVTNKVINDAAGTIDFSVKSGAGGTSGSGTLATITFHCTGPGNSNLTIASVAYYDPNGIQIPTTTAGGRVIQFSYWEPIKLQNLVEWPYKYALVDLPFSPPSSVEGYAQVKAQLEAKGYVFTLSYGGRKMEVHFLETQSGLTPPETTSGNVTSWWSNNTLADGTRACLVSAIMNDNTSIAMGFVTNLLPPEQITGVDPYIIYNAEPYFFIDFYWWSWTPIGQVIRWSYWWHDSHDHPDWFWGVYWWWRTYTKAYFLGLAWPPTNINWVLWRPWWGWWWHWIYWRHWYWWSTYFPYDP